MIFIKGGQYIDRISLVENFAHSTLLMNYFEQIPFAPTQI